MKKIILSLTLLSMSNVFATEYLITLDNKHYNNSIVIQQTEVIPPPVSPDVTESLTLVELTDNSH
jgi:hypothetical protein